VLLARAGLLICLPHMLWVLKQAYLFLSCNGWLSICASARRMPQLNCPPCGKDWCRLSLRWDSNLNL
jgi:hypothetical protein